MNRPVKGTVFWQLANHITKDSSIWIGFGCLLSWIFLGFWSSQASSVFTLSGLDAIFLYGLISASEALIALVIIYFSRKAVAFMRIELAWISALVTALGTFLLLYGANFHLGPWAYWILALAVGLGYGYLFVLWGCRIGNKDPKQVLIVVALSILFAVVIDAMTTIIAGVVFIGVTSLLPLASAFLFRKTKHETVFTEYQIAPKTGAKRVPIKILLPLAIAGLSYGLMQRLITPNSQTDDFINIAAFAIAAVSLFLTAFLFQKGKGIKVALPYAFSILAIAFVLMPLLPEKTAVVQLVYMLGYNYFYFLVWAMYGKTAKHFGLEIVQAYAGITAILAGTEFLGGLFGSQILLLIPSNFSFVTSLVAIYGFMLTALISFPYYSKVIENRAETEEGTDTLLPKLEKVAATYNLSKREREILSYLARGRNAQYVSEQLYISHDTARTHIKNIYKKMYVHSQQELLDLIDAVTEDK
ncbi:MAG: hypothetical protein HGA54_00345 [Actinobacteria bacterium]|nr:hypothetical protein [Actinomycetota bacterium]